MLPPTMAGRAQRMTGWWTWAAVTIALLGLGGSAAARARHGSHHRHHHHHQAHGAAKHRHHGHGGHHRRVHAPRGPSIGGLHPAVRTRLAAALSELRRHGVRPRVTSAYRSTGQQRAIYRCAQSRRCRLRRGIYGAKAPGHSTHEAGLAVDIAGIASHGPGRRRRLTGAGATIVRVMRRHQFAWRYGLRDPAHFELNPRRVGFSSTRVAIAAHRRPRATLARSRPARAVVIRASTGRYRARALRPWQSPRA